jgi:hypothetical protein
MYEVQSLLEAAINQKGILKGNEVMFWCPKCNKSFSNKKMSININPKSPKYGHWHCWVCENDSGTRGKRIKTFFDLYKVDPTYYHKLDYDYVQNNGSPKIPDHRQRLVVNLPAEFISLKNPTKGDTYKIAMAYLKKRNITYSDIIKYNLGYCDVGPFANMIIIPSYDSFGKLNYFAGRSLEKYTRFKYKYPEIDKSSIVFNELFINWDEPVVLVEGPFDFLATKINTIALLGKSICDDMKELLAEKRIKEIYLCLDSDAMKTAIKHTEYFIKRGIKVYFIELDKKDPSELGFNKMKEYLLSATPVGVNDFRKMLMLKLKATNKVN